MDIELRFITPIDRRIITVEFDATMPPREIVNEFIAAQVLEPGDYSLAVKGGALLDESTPIQDASLM